MDYLVSVIIPVYNSQQYIDECVKSVINQTYSNIEIILVDDGSKDKSGEMCDCWAKMDNRIKVVHKPNAGLGMARNTGLENVTGDYVEFLDSDDYISNDCVETLISQIKNRKAEVVYCKYARFDAERVYLDTASNSNIRVFSGEDIVENVLLEMVGSLPYARMDSGFDMSACTALYSMDIINKHTLRFKSEREYISEDLLFNVEFLRSANTVVAVDELLYYYRMNGNSLTTTYNPLRFSKDKIMYEYLKNYLGTFLEEKMYMLRVQRYMLARARVCINQIVRAGGRDISKKIAEVCDDETLVGILKHYPINRSPFKQRVFNIFLKYRMPKILTILVKVNH